VKQLEPGFCGRRPQQWPAGKKQLSPQHPLLWANGTHDASLKFRPSHPAHSSGIVREKAKAQAESHWHACYLIFWELGVRGV